MLCSPQKSSISCVSAIPPIAEPDRLRRPKIRQKDFTESGAAGTTVHYRSFVSDKGEQKRYTFAPKDARDSTVWDLREQLRRSESVTAGAGAR